MRTVVVPTATTRRPSPRARAMAAAVAGVRLARSGGIRCASTIAAVTGRKVAGPTCRVIAWTSTPAALSRSTTSRVKCSPAVGAATEPGAVAYTVW